MIPYFTLLLIAFVFSYVAKAETSYELAYGQNEYVSHNNWAVPAFFIFLWLMLVCRSIDVGRDLPNYQYSFEKINRLSFARIFQGDIEVLFALLNRLIGRLGGGFQILLTVCATVTIVPIAVLYNENKQHSYLKILIFVNMPLFVMLFSGIRQSVAIAIGVLAYRQVKKKNVVRFMLTVLLAMGFHESAFMLFPMYPLYYFRLRKRHLYIVIPAFILVYVFNRPIFSGLLRVMSALGSKHETVAYSYNGAVTSLVLFCVFALFTYIVPDDNKLSEDFIGIRNFLLLTTMLQCFAPLHTLAMRMNYYYILFVPLAVSMTLDVPSPKWEQVAYIAEIVLCIFFTAYFVMSIISGGSLDTVPYIPFWKL